MNRVEAYLDALVARVDAQPGTRLVGIWLFGSTALGDLDARRSDLDVQAVSSARRARRPTSAEVRNAGSVAS